MTKREQLEARVEYFRRRLEEGHRSKAVVTRWRRELLRTRALVACLDDGRKRPWTEYLETPEEVRR